MIMHVFCIYKIYRNLTKTAKIHCDNVLFFMQGRAVTPSLMTLISIVTDKKEARNNSIQLETTSHPGEHLESPAISRKFESVQILHHRPVPSLQLQFESILLH